MEKWALLYNTDGTRYDVMMTNLVEVYNWAIMDLHVMLLIAIVEGMLHGIVTYFRERQSVAALHMLNA